MYLLNFTCDMCVCVWRERERERERGGGGREGGIVMHVSFVYKIMR